MKGRAWLCLCFAAANDETEMPDSRVGAQLLPLASYFRQTACNYLPIQNH